ncbi:TPA: DEAD/DEAH box helicase, partial [Neisseria meningitidis]
MSIKFADLNLDKNILSAVSSEGYESPTPIQAQAIP